MRISRQVMAMTMARAASLRGTCHRLNVGAVLLEDNRVVATGYNGSPSKEPHCYDVGCLHVKGKPGCQRTIHAERNIIDFYHEHFDAGSSYSIYTTHSPCKDCWELMEKTHYIDNVYYETAFRDMDHLSNASHIALFQVLPSGVIINHYTREIVLG